MPAKIRDDVQPKVPQYRRQTEAILAASRKGVQDGLKGQHNSHKRQVEVIARQLGKPVLADKKDFYAWEISRYSNIYRDERPDLASLPLESVDVTMAMDEFRDKVFMVNSCGKDVRQAVEIHPSPDLPAKAIQVRQSLYFRFKNGQEELGDALYDLDGPLEIPRDQSRQVWLTFDTRFNGIKPGEYHFDVVLRDLDTGTQRSVLGRLRIWDFTLPNYDILANNGYVEFFNGEVGLKVRDKAVTHMKRYGLNMVFIYWNFMPFPVEIDADLNITGFDATNLEQQVRPVIQAWRAAPGNNQRLRFILQLSYLPDKLVADKSIKYPNERWKKVFTQWLRRLKTTLGEWELSEEDCVFFLADESNMSVLLNYELPFAELIKSIDPNVQIMCNRGPGIRDRDASFRFYRAFNSVLSCGDREKQYPYLAQWIEQGNQPPELWTYQAADMSGRTKNLYSYYRVYGWQNFKYGIIGPGVWTYCARAQSPWGKNKEMVGHCLVYKHRDKNALVHSRRYEFYREGVDDYRYLYALRLLAQTNGPRAQTSAEQLIRQAIQDITADVTDTTRCDRWRIKIAEQILKLKAAE